MALNFRRFLEGLALIPKSSSTVDQQGEMEVLSSSGKLNYHNGTSASPVVTEAHSAALTNKTIDADSNTITNIDNADIKSGANIARDKLASGNAYRVVANNASGVLSDAAAITANRALASDANGIPTHSATTDTELGYVSGVTSSIQTQLNGKQATGNYITDLTGEVTASGPGSVAATIASGAVTTSKLGTITDGITLDQSGVGSTLEVKSGGISNTQISNSAAIARSKIASGTANHVVINDGSGNLSSEAALAQSRGGTGFSTYTTGDLLYASASNTLSKLGIGSNGTVLTSNGTNMSWSAVSNPVTYTATAGENLTANDAVYICNNALDAVGGARTVGRAYKLDVTNGFRVVFAGFVVSTVTSGNTATIQVAGELSGFTGLNTGQQIWASVTTPGSFQTTAPSSSSLIVPLGQASTTTGKLLINGALYATNSGTVPIGELYTYGYFAGGANSGGSDTTTTDKMTFATESMGTVSSAIPAVNRDGCGGSGSDRGFIMGSAVPSSRSNVVQKLLYSSDTYSALGAILGSGVQGAVGAQSTTKAYRLAGDTGTATNTIDSVQFSNDTRVSVSSTFGTAVRETAGCTNTGTAGYVFGGDTPVNTIQKLVFSGETTSTPSATLSNSTGQVCGTYSTTKGYRNSGTTGTTVIDALTFATDSRATLSATLSQSYRDGTGVSSSNKGYVAGGSGSNNTTINALVFTTEACSSISAVLSNSRQNVPTGLRA